MFEKFNVPEELIPSDPRFGVGPSLIPTEAVHNLAQTGASLLGTGHRKMPVRNLVHEMREGLRTYFKLPDGYEVIIGNGGATFLWDMIGLGLVESKSAHFICGEFSDKWFRAHSSIPWIKATPFKVEFGKGINPREEFGHDLICSTLNETSTGVQLTELPRLQDPLTLMAIDATSGAGQIKTDFSKVDVYYFSPQKVFASEGGFYVCVLSPKAITRALRLAEDRTRFIPESMKWTHAIENSRLDQTYNTPAISTIFFLNEQIKLMNKWGEDKIIEQAKKKASLVYNWADSKPYLSAFVDQKEFRSHAVATIDLDARINVDDLTKMLREKRVAYDIDGYRKLNRNQLMI
jgi:phosphoserine aminotransferase